MLVPKYTSYPEAFVAEAQERSWSKGTSTAPLTGVPVVTASGRGGKVVKVNSTPEVVPATFLLSTLQA